MRATALAGLAILTLAGCKREDMYTQGSSRNWDRNAFFANGTSMRHPPAGAVARHAPDPPAAEPAVITQALLDRGEQRYEIFCTPCHGRAGNGEGMIVQRGFQRPQSLVSGPLRMARAEVFYDAITNGYGTMYSYDSRVAPADRWAIIAYIRALQLSQGADPATLPAADRAQIEAAK